MASTIQLPIWLDTPNASGNAYAGFSSNFGFTPANIGRHVCPAFVKSLDGTWEGILRIPQNYASAGAVILSWAANATTGNLRHRVSTCVVAAGASYNGTYTDESYVNTTVPGTALFRFDTTFTLTTTPSNGGDLFVKVTRNGSSGSDTLAVDALLLKAVFQYTST
jgi:hypothetical protein